MKCLLAGYGEIGKAVREIFIEENVIDIIDTSSEFKLLVNTVDYEFLLVCFPYTDCFVDEVKRYVKEYRCKNVIIFSTVAVGTTEQIENAVHCPIEGKHPHLFDSIRLWKFTVGGRNSSVIQFLNKSEVPFEVIDNPKITEFLKLASTSYYGVMLEYIRYVDKTIYELGGDFKSFAEYNKNYNRLYSNLGHKEFTRPQLYPPYGNIGGHCVVPNSKILDEQFPSPFLKEIYREKENI